VGATDLNLHATTCRGRQEKDMIRYWRKPAGTADISKALERTETHVPPTWEKQRWRILAFSFFTARVNRCLLRFSPQNSLLKHHTHTQSKRLWKYTHWRCQHSVSCLPTKSWSKHPHSKHLFELHSQFQSAPEMNFPPSKTVSISSATTACPSLTGFNRTGDVNRTKLKDPLQPSYFGSPCKSCIISRSQAFPSVNTEQPNNRIKKPLQRPYTASVPSLQQPLF